jgi:hypothetical protein
MRFGKRHDLDAEFRQEGQEFFSALTPAPRADDNACFIEGDGTRERPRGVSHDGQKAFGFRLLFKNGMKTELSMTIIRNCPRLFKDVLRRARIKQRPGGYTPRYVARAVDVGGLSGCLHNDDASNACLHLDACFQYILKSPAAPCGDAARKLFGFWGQGNGHEIFRRCLGNSIF